MPPLPWSVKETDEEKEEYDIKHGFDKLRTERGKGSRQSCCMNSANWCLEVDDFQEGIPQLAAFLNSNDSFTHHRKWGQITNRVLLYRSIELAQLSKKLSDLDNEYASDDTKKYCLKGWEPENWGKEQKDLILEIEKKLEIYRAFMFGETNAGWWFWRHISVAIQPCLWSTSNPSRPTEKSIQLGLE